jgi:hypothetical protein
VHLRNIGEEEEMNGGRSKKGKRGRKERDEERKERMESDLLYIIGRLERK